MAEPVVVVAPARRGQQDVEGGDRLPPREVPALIVPLRVLDGHGGRHHRERLVAGEEAVAPGEGVALEPPLAAVLAQHLHHPAVGRDVVVGRKDGADEAAVLGLEDVAEAVRVRLVRAEEPEVRPPCGPAEDVPQKLAQWARGLEPLRRWRGHRDRVLTVVRQVEVHQFLAAVGVRVRAQAAAPRGGERRQLGNEPPVGVE